MARTLLVLIACAALIPTSVRAAEPVQLKSVSVDFPPDRRTFPPGPGSDAVDGNCLACHSAGMVLYQPTLTKAQWEAEVTKMRNVYKAPVETADVDAIVGYLVMQSGDAASR
jgi:hypothetical protein